VSGTAARTGLESDESSGFMSAFGLFAGDRAPRRVDTLLNRTWWKQLEANPEANPDWYIIT